MGHPHQQTCPGTWDPPKNFLGLLSNLPLANRFLSASSSDQGEPVFHLCVTSQIPELPVFSSLPHLPTMLRPPTPFSLCPSFFPAQATHLPLRYFQGLSKIREKSQVQRKLSRWRACRGIGGERQDREGQQGRLRLAACLGAPCRRAHSVPGSAGLGHSHPRHGHPWKTVSPSLLSHTLPSSRVAPAL